jgi:DNA-directed RNA polymerase sigma subunit (sigma70/sigma32)
MTLRQVAERMGISYARVKQIESSALTKIRKHIKKNNLTF